MYSREIHRRKQNIERAMDAQAIGRDLMAYGNELSDLVVYAAGKQIAVAGRQACLRLEPTTKKAA